MLCELIDRTEDRVVETVSKERVARNRVAHVISKLGDVNGEVVAKEEVIQQHGHRVILQSSLTLDQIGETDLSPLENEDSVVRVLLPGHIGLILAGHDEGRGTVLEGTDGVEGALFSNSKPLLPALDLPCQGVIWILWVQLTMSNS